MKLSAAFVALGLVAFPDDTDACQCFPDPDPRAYRLPSGKVPCNAHVFLRDVRSIGKLALIETKTKRAVPFTHVELAAGFYELVPKRLAPNTSYDVIENGRTILRFETTAQNDKQAPVVDTVTGELVFNQIGDSCDSGIKPYIKAQVTIPANAETPPLIAVWRGDDRGKVDFAKPPNTVASLFVYDSGLRFELGYFNMCSRPNMTVSGRTYGFKVIDLAGNRSAPIMLTLPSDVPRPR